MDRAFLKALTEVPSAGTACGPALNLLATRFEGYASTFVPDGFRLFQKGEPAPDRLRVVLVAHVDEIGGCVYGPRGDGEGGGFNARVWGNIPEVFANATLQAWDYLAERADEAFPVGADIVVGPPPPQAISNPDGPPPAREKRLVLRGERIRPYRTVWTFREETTVDGDLIEGKALDPRATAYAVAEAARALDTPEVGALFVMAEECAMDVARKAVTFLSRHAPRLKGVVNADVPWIHNIGEGRLDLPAIRVFEGRNFIDPSFGIRMSDRLASRGVPFHLTAARSGSQTILFTPIAPTISVALPSDGVHAPRVRMSLTGIDRCTGLLEAIAKEILAAP